MRFFDSADFKFLGPKSKFERNGRKRFSNFRNQIHAPKFKIEIEFQVLRCQFCIFRKPKFFKNQNFGFGVPISHFPETQFFKNRNFKFWQSRFLHFHSILNQIFEFLGSICRIFLRISLNAPKFCSPNFSSTRLFVPLDTRSTKVQLTS